MTTSEALRSLDNESEDAKDDEEWDDDGDGECEGDEWNGDEIWKEDRFCGCRGKFVSDWVARLKGAGAAMGPPIRSKYTYQRTPWQSLTVALKDSCSAAFFTFFIRSMPTIRKALDSSLVVYSD